MRLRRSSKMYNVKDMTYVSNQRKTYTKFSVYITLLVIAVSLSIAPYFLKLKSESPAQMHVKFPTDLKYILIWKTKNKKEVTRKNNQPQFAIGQTLFIKQKCQYINCYITYNRDMLKNDYFYDAIVFDIHEIRKTTIQDYNLTRASYQKYIFRSMESSETHPVCKGFYENFFNWTWSYRLDSDIPHPFIDIKDLNNKFIGPAKNITWIEKMKHNEKADGKIKRKKKAIAWLVESCKLKAKHKDFVNDLTMELKGYNHTIDIYGSCGSKKCPSGGLYKCYKMIEKEYFFQLVLEDSFAEDYVSEKIVKVLQLTIIPVVLGGADYKRFLPPGTYINAQAFDMKKLGAIIDYLIKKPQIYSYFLDWKNHYTYSIRPKNYVCDVCAELNDDNSVSKSIDNFRKWWNPDFEDICTREKLYYKFAKDSASDSLK